jgi:hypothetical protein
MQRLNADSTRKEFAAVHAHLFGLKQQIADVMNELQRLKGDQQRDNKRIYGALRRIAMAPVARLRAGSAAEDAIEHSTRRQLTKLSRRPRDLYELWHEYEFGLGGSKPAKHLNLAERGANKCTFSRRKVFWDVVAGLVRAGFTSDTAIDKVYAAYGSRLSVTAILKSLQRDRVRGGHPELQP